MDVITDLDAAVAVVGDTCAAVDGVRAAELWRLSSRDLLDLSVAVERLSRLVFATQVSLAGELDSQNAAADHGCVSTAALLRQTLAISASDAKTRVDTAQAVLPRESLSGGDIPPVLPLLGDALAVGAIGVEQTRTIVVSMKKITAKADDDLRDLCQQHLVDNGILTEPKPFAAFARSVVGVVCGDDEPDEDRSTKVELFLGVRNPETGMTRFHGQLDDLGVEVVSQAIDALAKPRPASSPDGSDAKQAADMTGSAGAAEAAGATGSAGTAEAAEAAGSASAAGAAEAAGAAGEKSPGNGTAADVGGAAGTDRADSDGGPRPGDPTAGVPGDTTDPDGRGGAAGSGAGSSGAAGSPGAVGSADEPIPDSRSAACRRGQAMIEALRRFLDHGTAPIQGGQRPHITVTIGLDELRRGVGTGCLNFGGPVSAGMLRMLACDATIIPAVLGGASQVLDVGRSNRLFPPGIRRAIELRDRGCAFPGCDRPPGWTEAHHIIHWVNNGPSSLDNGCLLCSHHHSVIHRGHWEVWMAADGLPEFLPPTWIDKARNPRRNTSHHLPLLLAR